MDKEIKQFIRDEIQKLKEELQNDLSFGFEKNEVREFLDAQLNGKTSRLKLKDLPADPATGKQGELISVNGVLKIYGAGSWNTV